MKCGIYKITNIQNGKVYIGQATNIEYRWTRHRNNYNNTDNSQYNSKIYRAIRKYGIENFIFEIVEECKPNELNEKEIYWIQQYDAYAKGYNSTLGGNHAVPQKLDIKEVQQIINLLQTTSKTNLEIAQEFNVSENTISGINTGYYWKLSDYEYPIRKQKRNETKYCEICGTALKTQAHYCPSCANVLRRKVERPDKDILKELLFQNKGNFTLVGQKYGVSDNTIRKWCISMNLPYHSKDYKEAKVKQEVSKSCPVQQIDLQTGKIIATYESIRQAQQITGIDHIYAASDENNITRKTAGGYKWKRINTNEDK